MPTIQKFPAMARTLTPASSTFIHVPNANTAAVVTLAATAGWAWIVERIVWSYSATPTGGRLTIVETETTVLDIDITSGGPGPFEVGEEYSAGAAVVITLAAGSGSVVGKLNVKARLVRRD